MFIGSLDQSTTATKFALFRPNGQQVKVFHRDHEQISIKEGWLEHNPEEIIKNVYECFDEASQYLKQNGHDLSSLKTLGICNQRQTVVAWDVDTGKPLNNAIVWCDTRTSKIAEEFGKQHLDLKKKTGLIPSSYFSLFKILWLLENNQQVKQRLDEGKVRFGTIDSWVVWNLTGRYITDASNASRTFLYNLQGHWDEDIIKLANLNKECLPQVVDSFGKIGEIQHGSFKGVTIGCVLGDQQASAFAHNLQKNHIKCSYGTGCFLIMNLGSEAKIFENFITTILYKSEKHIEYGLEISIEAGAGIINWLKKMDLLKQFDELNNLPGNNGVFFYPTFGSVFSPFWSNNVTGTFVGLGLHSNKANILRAVLDSICFRVFDNISHAQLPKVESFRADGGMTKNKSMMQFQSDLMKIPIQICKLDTMWGVAKGAMRGLGIEAEKEIESVVDELAPSQEANEKAIQIYRKWNSQRWRSEKWV